MTVAVDIRRVDRADAWMLDACSGLLQDLSALHARIEPQVHEREGGDLRPLRRFQRALETPRRAVALAAIKDDPDSSKVVGVAVVHLESGEAGPMQIKVAVLTDLVVSDERRRRGIGRRLFEASRQWASGAGAERLAVNVRERNVEALRFYEAIGCRSVSRWMTLATMGGVSCGMDRLGEVRPFMKERVRTR